MRVVGFTEFGGPEVMRAIELPEPHAGDGQVRVRVVAADVNPSDTLAREGLTRVDYQGEPWFPPSDVYIVGWDATGHIDEVGGGVEGFSIGEPVALLAKPSQTFGAQAEYVVAPAWAVVRVPEESDLIAWSTLLMNAITARDALEKLELASGATVAVTGAAGAVGGYAVQLAKARGFTVVADAADKDRALVQALGADHIVPRGDGFAARVRALAPEGAHGVIDTAMLTNKAHDAVRDGGVIAPLRPLTESGTLQSYTGPRERGVRWELPNVLNYFGNNAALAEIRDLAAAGTLTPRVARTFAPEQAALAHRALELGGLRGRPVIVFDPNYPNAHPQAAEQ
ncbi:alcohol dehydrogenase catalytic domain-containing protein [Segniliparus rugosus]|uniref:Enoyl reductase (ER) domain-containing protein n=1 Tax=Segniliparus rugosus (strain ATCC BAA-974 / DSM 45345 / CCUG 50838 / CIP 108380 / JCM 13579 / CDC 945) TaxID=679197 RepID=E5XNK8_SEGRC|nr:zinc-binding dehydrogenase [Segniliparus rugosus]EFV14120.1 hypothetical protein HMPREF9336_01037 [Segniliparus rugosus ATCC BAA-974]